MKAPTMSRPYDVLYDAAIMTHAPAAASSAADTNTTRLPYLAARRADGTANKGERQSYG